MNIFVLICNANSNAYNEILTTYLDIEEKEKSYVGYGKRFDKSKIGKIEGGKIKGSYTCILIDENLLDEKREAIKEIILKEKQKELDELTKSVEHIKKHSLDAKLNVNFIQ